jgi:hypothetical protein
LQISLFKEYKENPAQTLIQCITNFHGNTHILFEYTYTYQQINKILYNTIKDGYSTKIKNKSIIYHIAISKIKFDLNKYETFDFDFDFWCFRATFSNISAISWRPALVVEE